MAKSRGEWLVSPGRDGHGEDVPRPWRQVRLGGIAIAVGLQVANAPSMQSRGSAVRQEFDHRELDGVYDDSSREVDISSDSRHYYCAVRKNAVTRPCPCDDALQLMSDVHHESSPPRATDSSASFLSTRIVAMSCHSRSSERWRR
jgi:hypothetical protein